MLKVTTTAGIFFTEGNNLGKKVIFKDSICERPVIEIDNKIRINVDHLVSIEIIKRNFIQLYISHLWKKIKNYIK